MVDQGVSGLSNVVVSVFVARSLSESEFGAFSVAAIVAMLTMGVSRALIGEPLLSRFSAVAAEVRARLVPDMLGAALVVSVVVAAVVAVVGAVLGGQAGTALLALALVLPLIVVQDTWRYAFIVDRPAAALGVDVVWLAGVCVALPLAPGGAEAAWYVVAWGLAGGRGRGGGAGARAGGRGVGPAPVALAARQPGDGRAVPRRVRDRPVGRPVRRGRRGRDRRAGHAGRRAGGPGRSTGRSTRSTRASSWPSCRRGPRSAASRTGCGA